MRTPIAFALGYPERITAGVEPLELARIGTLHFERPDLQRFPCLRLAYEALEAGGTAPTALNAANEVAVSSFLSGALRFRQIPALIEAVLSDSAPRAVERIEDVLAADRRAREQAEKWLVASSAENGAASARPARAGESPAAPRARMIRP
jgi:1-deoxy-D-xylulose-5-phosphate reductoisomerase